MQDLDKYAKQLIDMFPEEKGSSDEEEEGEEEEEEVTRDGTLLASEPARPLYVATYLSCF